MVSNFIFQIVKNTKEKVVASFVIPLLAEHRQANAA